MITNVKIDLESVLKNISISGYLLEESSISVESEQLIDHRDMALFADISAESEIWTEDVFGSHIPQSMSAWGSIQIENLELLDGEGEKIELSEFEKNSIIKEIKTHF